MPFQLIDARQILVKAEGTEGVDSVPVGTTDAALTFDGTVEIEFDELERKVDRASLGAYAKRLIGKRARIKYTIELLGNAVAGTAAPINPILRSTGRASTLTASTRDAYNPISTGIVSLTHYFFWGGLRFRVFGSRASMNAMYEIDQRPRGEIEVLGVVEPATLSEQAIPAVTLTAFREPPIITEGNWQVTVNGVTLECFKLNINDSNDLIMRHHSEARRVVVGQRAKGGSFLIDPSALASFNPWALAEAATLVPIISLVDGGATNRIRHTCAQAQLLAPKLVEQQRGLAWEIPFSAPPSAAGNNDDLLEFE
jgi:hypothetical protein